MKDFNENMGNAILKLCDIFEQHKVEFDGMVDNFGITSTLKNPNGKNYAIKMIVADEGYDFDSETP